MRKPAAAPLAVSVLTKMGSAAVLSVRVEQRQHARVGGGVAETRQRALHAEGITSLLHMPCFEQR